MPVLHNILRAIITDIRVRVTKGCWRRFKRTHNNNIITYGTLKTYNDESFHTGKIQHTVLLYISSQLEQYKLNELKATPSN